MKENKDKVDYYLDELAEEYKHILLSLLLERSDSYEEPSITELLRIDGEVKDRLLNRTLHRKKQYFLLAGMAYMVFGILLYFGYEIIKDNTVDIISLTSITIGITGLLMTVLVILRNQLIPKPKEFMHKKQQLLFYNVVKLWREFEGLSNDLMDESNPGSVLSLLEENTLVTNSEGETLRKLLRIRNEIVHTQQTHYANKDIFDILRASEGILANLKRRLLNP